MLMICLKTEKKEARREINCWKSRTCLGKWIFSGLDKLFSRRVLMPAFRPKKKRFCPSSAKPVLFISTCWICPHWWCDKNGVPVAPCAENDKINVLDEPYFEQLSSLSNLRDPREEHSATYFCKRPGIWWVAPVSRKVKVSRHSFKVSLGQTLAWLGSKVIEETKIHNYDLWFCL